ncbi:MAG: TetR/AcrR family transcriptional regulator [Deltaproteobacteria bacterium]|nr:TetR/AcrR family transcriptional regulator [Deltaproteobacteria bacterium]MCL5792183.1 TetR/AcrR family transcriptional regulator [Deltaproteobacteria bacterium]
MLHEERKLLILSAAKEMFAIKGYHETSISDIIKRADIARGTFYIYFKDKREIFDALFDQLLERINNAVKRVIVGKDQKPPLEQISDNIKRVFQFATDDPELARILFRHAPGLDGITDQKIDSFYNKITALIESALTLGIQMNLVKQCNLKLIAAFITGGIKEIMDKITRTDNNLPRVDIIIKGLIDFSLYGLSLK